jgi:hypothetical protein
MISSLFRLCRYESLTGLTILRTTDIEEAFSPKMANSMLQRMRTLEEKGAAFSQMPVSDLAIKGTNSSPNLYVCTDAVIIVQMLQIWTCTCRYVVQVETVDFGTPSKLRKLQSWSLSAKAFSVPPAGKDVCEMDVLFGMAHGCFE